MKQRKPRRPRLTYANVMSSIAVFMVLAGGAAVALPGKNTVNSGDVIDNTLKSKDLKNGKGVTGRDVKNNTLRGADVVESSLKGVPGTWRAYAEIAGTGVVEANSAGVTDANVTNPAPGVWCINVPFTPLHAQATGQAQGGSDDIAMVNMTPTVTCPAGTDVEVRNYDVSAAAQANDTVFLALW